MQRPPATFSNAALPMYMKRIVAIGLFTAASAIAFAVPTKISVAAALPASIVKVSSTQGVLTVYRWVQLHHTRPFQYIPISVTPIDGPDQNQYIGGPLNNT